MRLWLEILDGARKGARFELKPGITIGRGKADITIEDPRISAIHAKIELRQDVWWLKDLGSSNKIKIETGRVDELKLEPDQKFSLGRIRFAILAESQVIKKAEESAKTPPGPAPVVTLPPPPSEIDGAKKEEKPVLDNTWRTPVANLLDHALRESRPVTRPLQIFPHLLVLRIVEGSQAGTVWTLGYGPRDFGAGSLDLPIWEADIPKHCFRIELKDKGMMLKVDNRALQFVRLNGEPVESAPIRDQDVLEVGSTRIEIAFEELTEGN